VELYLTAHYDWQYWMVVNARGYRIDATGLRIAPSPGLVVEHLFDNTCPVVYPKHHPLAASRALKTLGGAD